MVRNQEYIKTDISQMETYLSRREQKYRRNFNRYYNNGNRSEDIWNIYGNVLAYYNPLDQLGNIPYINVLRSCVDTMLSKLSQTKVRPFFNPVNGTFKTTKVCKNAQIFFDEYYEQQDIYKKLLSSLFDALVFDMGVIWADDETANVSRIPPWEFHFDAGEMSIGKLTRCAIIKKQYPLIDLRDIIKKESDYYTAMESTPNAYVKLVRYYDLLGKKEYLYIGNELIRERKISYDVAPFQWIYYKEPVKGAFSDSMMDTVYPIQRMIDELTYKISTAAQLSPTNTIFIPRGSDIKTSIYASSKIGDVFEYNIAGAGSSNQVTVATPPAIDRQYMELLELFEQKMYNITGVSQLSAQSKKPSGINSGVALQTLEDVESERHNPILGNYIRLARDLAERIIDIYPENQDVLPVRQSRSTIKWGDIKKERRMFSMQFSASSSLSKDPKVKMEQIEKLMNMKILDPSMAATLLDMPDLEGAYSITTAAYNSNEKTIERVVENGPEEDGTYGFFECTDINLLYKQAVNTLLRLDASDESPEVLDRLVQFIKQVKGTIDTINQAIMPPVQPVAPPVQPPVGPPAA